MWLDSGQKAREWRLDLKSRDGIRVPVNTSTGEESTAGEDLVPRQDGNRERKRSLLGALTISPEPVLHQGPYPP